MTPFHSLPVGRQEGGEGVAVPGRPQGGVGQGGELGVGGAGVEGHCGVGLTDVDEVRGGGPGVPPVLGLPTGLAQHLTIHYLNCRESG